MYARLCRDCKYWNFSSFHSYISNKLNCSSIENMIWMKRHLYLVIFWLEIWSRKRFVRNRRDYLNFVLSRNHITALYIDLGDHAESQMLVGLQRYEQARQEWPWYEAIDDLRRRCQKSLWTIFPETASFVSYYAESKFPRSRRNNTYLDSICQCASCIQAKSCENPFQSHPLTL